MANPKINPFHPSLNYIFASVESPLYAMRLIRTIAFNLDVSPDEVEILIGLAAQRHPVDLEKICTFVPHLTVRKIRNLVRKLKNIKAVNVMDPDLEDHYVISPNLAQRIKDIDKESLQQTVD
jgi:hypothetical protein